MDWEKTYKDLKKLNWFSLLIMSLTSFFLMSSSFTLGVILGGFIIIANFKVLQHTIRRGFSSEGAMNASKFFIIVKYYLRLLALGAVICYLIKRGWADPVGLAVGLSTVVISIVSFGIKTAFKTVTGEAT
ncbi:MAG: ATP synthase subunit I [Deltaproteobacteria bacterium]|nr:MAG: ATP synthase subunit I [Deltaproteobacteria bacterium]